MSGGKKPKMKAGGRPRKPSDVHLSGHLKTTPVEPLTGAAWQRIKQHGERLGIDARLGTEIGRLAWFGELTTLQAAVALHVAEVYGRYERHQGLSRSPRSPAYERSYGRPGVDDGRLSQEMADENAQAMRSATKAFMRLQDQIPVNMRDLVEQLCVEDRSILPVHYEALRGLLDRLALHFRLRGA